MGMRGVSRMPACEEAGFLLWVGMEGRGGRCVIS